MPHLVLIIILLFFSFFLSKAATLEVGPGKPYASAAAASVDALPGDTILLFPGNYSGSNFISDLHGTESDPIYIIGTDVETVIFGGGSLGMQLSQVSYLHIQKLSFTGHTGNGFNIDDGGTFATPTHHLIIQNCRFYNMGANGNNDFLKMSGVDYFEVSGCTFLHGAAGGSGIDMVGCHHGEIHNNDFQNLGSNCIQAKGGTQFISIYQNRFENGGQRTLNLGGSTGLEFFRPQNAPFEAADLDVYANIFIGSTAPIAYVGCVRVHVVNNTIITPGNWIMRILQETVDPDRFLPCGDNSFINNLVYFTNAISTHVNIGPDTAPNTFAFSNNLWYNSSSPGNSTPNLPVVETGPIIGENPLFFSFSNQDFSLTVGSPAVNAGTNTAFTEDYEGNIRPQLGAYDIGAYEYSSSLPVALTGFRLEPDGNQGIHIIWETSTEINSNYFDIERSPDGRSWGTIATRQAAGHTQSTVIYQVLDPKPLKGLNFYRLKQVDLDDSHQYSPIRSIYLSNTNPAVLKIFPNPFHNYITLEGYELEYIKIYDIFGREVRSQTTIETNNLQETVIRTDGLSPGQYILRTGAGTKVIIKE